MSALSQHAVSAAYLGQQASLQLGCAALQSVARRFLLPKPRRRPGPAAARELWRRYVALLARDLANVHAGSYPARLLFDIPWASYARTLPRLAADLPRVVRRAEAGDFRELPHDIDLSRYPPYYRRTFHWQSDGYLSRRSAELYDVGVELLFGGTADVMRRQALVPLVEHARGHAAGPRRILDVACGTGRTLAQIHAALPTAALTGLDLSPYYLDAARTRLDGGPRLVAGNAEAMPFPDASFDAVVSVYLFHELPRNARRRVAAEMLRVLAPGGRVVLVDAIQLSDAPDMQWALEGFEREMHEPFFRDYVKDDLASLLADVGFAITTPAGAAFLSKVVVAEVPVPA